MSGPEVLVPMSFFFTVGVVFVSRSEIGRAIADRIRGRRVPDDRIADEVTYLRSELDLLRQELAEVHDRLDFAERLLAQPERRAGTHLGPASEVR